MVKPVEEAVSGLDGIKEITATAQEDRGAVLVEVMEGEDPDLVLQDVKSAVDRITTFPEEVARPVTFSILTTVAAFSPLLFVSGVIGKFMYSIPVIVIAVLLASLLESLFVLPAHLSRSRVRLEAEEQAHPGRLVQLKRGFNNVMERLVRTPYRHLLALSIRHRYSTLAFS